MRFAVATLGSLGDLHPFLAVARALAEAGHEVSLLAQEPHREEVQQQGLRFEPILSREAHERAQCHPLLWHPIKGFGVMWRYLAVPSIAPVLSTLARLGEGCAAGEPLRVFASPLVVGARLAQELLPGIQLSTGLTAPAHLRSAAHPMFLGAKLAPAWWPAAARRALWRWLDASKLEPMAGPLIHRLRAEHGLAPLRAPIFARWLHSPQQIIGMFPADFGPMQKDWPAQLDCCGFPLYLGELPQALPGDQPPHLPTATPALTSLAAPRLVFYPGSSPTRQQATMYALASHFAGQGCDCLFIGSPPEPGDTLSPLTASPLTASPFTASPLALSLTTQGPTSPDPANGLTQPPAGRLQFQARVHLPEVLRGAAAFVHHGGIGAVAHGLACGVPQVILPAAHDQFDNAWRVRSLQGQAWQTPTADWACAQIEKALLAWRERPGGPQPSDGQAKTTSLTPSHPAAQAATWARYSLPGRPNAAVQQIVSRLSQPALALPQPRR